MNEDDHPGLLGIKWTTPRAMGGMKMNGTRNGPIELECWANNRWYRCRFDGSIPPSLETEITIRKKRGEMIKMIMKDYDESEVKKE